MRTRKIKKNFWFNEEEARYLKSKSEKLNKTESEIIRLSLAKIIIKEKPDDRFYEVMKQLRSIGNNLNQIARVANTLGFIDVPNYKNAVDKLNSFIIDVKREFLDRV